MGNKSDSERAPVIVPGEPWLITEAGLAQILAAEAREVDVQAVLARRGDTPGHYESVEIRDGVAVLSVNGPILRYGGGFLSYFFRIAAIEGMARDFARVIDDPAVAAVVLNVDSPGGQVSGTNEFAEMVYAARGKKPVVAYVNATGASAAYWIASAAGNIVLDPTAAVGSIGVVATVAKKDAGRGYVEVVSSASPKKMLDPESDGGRAEILRIIDAIAGVFVAKVARNRGVSEDTVLARYGQGGVLVGESAVAAGMADAVGSLEAVIEELARGRGNTGRKGGLGMKKFTAEELEAALTQIRAEAPAMLDADVKERVEAIHKDGEKAGYERGFCEGTAAERTRVVEILKAEAGAAVTRKAIEEGTGAEAAYKLFYEAVRGEKAARLAELQADATAAVGAVAPADEQGEKDFEALVTEEMAAGGCKKSVAMRVVMKRNPEEHAAWLKKQQR